MHGADSNLRSSRIGAIIAQQQQARFVAEAQGNGAGGRNDGTDGGPILSQNRYGREDILSLFRPAPAPQSMVDCRFYVEESQPPAILEPQTEAEIRAHSNNINSSKAARDHIHNGGSVSSPSGINGGPSLFSPSWAQQAQRGGRTTTYGRGGGMAGVNPRAQALFDPKDPKDRPRNRLRSGGEDSPIGCGSNPWSAPGTGAPRGVAKPATPIGVRPDRTERSEPRQERQEQPDTSSRNLQGPWRRQESVPGGTPPTTPGADPSRISKEPEWANETWQTEPGVSNGSFDEEGHFRPATDRQLPPVSAPPTSLPAWMPPKEEPGWSKEQPPQWYYCDPNGDSHGPFAKENMHGWFVNGYFSGDLKVRRDCDSQFTTLSELCHIYGDSEPFNMSKAPSPPVGFVPGPKAPSPPILQQVPVPPTAWGIGAQRAGVPAPEFLRLEEENRRLAEEQRRLLMIQQTILSEKNQVEEKERAIRELEERVKRQAEEFQRMRQEQMERERQRDLELEAERARLRQIEMEKEAVLRAKEQELLLKEEMARQKTAMDEANRRHEELLERQRQQEEERRLWEMQKDQFETTRKNKEAKLKEKMEEDAKRKKKEELEEQKRLKEEELERQRQLEIMRTRDTKVILTESVSKDDSPPASRPVKVEALKPAPWVLKSDKNDMRNLRDIQLEEERRAMEQMKIDKERKEAFRKTQAAEASKMWSNSSSRLNWGGAAAPAWGGAGVHSPPVHAMFDGPALVATPPAPKPKAPEQKKAAASAPVKVAKKSDQPKKIAPKDDPLSKWVIQRVKKLDSSVEADVFAGFIRDVVSPNEVEDYIFSYFGETSQSKEFCKEFISRRSELRSKNKAPDRDDLSRPAQAAQTPTTNPAPSATQAAAAGKKKKKGKGIKLIVDSSSLGFRAVADPSRINAGEIDVVENAW
ncbi:hypothetical protein L596_008864 [Steinernema carpocapsae]|uniref:GYF domain-containing protein n=1 Tax=Steinernema carpocapsae TaxID=34508 RepID=A0A4U5PEJ4_STECR|nr:hypothetical protein L596_008864 [Steinernema carpocapsae]